MEEERMMNVEVREQISNVIEAIEHTEADEQMSTALTVCTLLVIRFTDNSYAAIGAFEIMKKGVMEAVKKLYSSGELNMEKVMEK